MMLSCDTATFLITKASFDKLSFMERIKLRLHLAGCKYCRRFKKQSEYISFVIRRNKDIPDKSHLTLHLTAEQKKRIKKKLT